MGGNQQKSRIKAVTATDVARLAGVSRTQVSYVLNNMMLDHVSESNKRKILDAANELGYQPHSSAQVLRRGFSKEFSIFFPAPYPPRINSVISKIHESGLKEGFSPIQYSFNSYENEGRMYQSLDTMLNRKPFGVFCSLLDISRKEIDYMYEKGVKKVLVWDVEDHDDLNVIFVPLYRLGALAAEYFRKKGYRDVCFLKPSDPIQRRPFDLKLAGFSDAWGDSPLNLTIESWPDRAYRPTLESTGIFVDRILSAEKMPEIIYAFSDDYALPLMSILRERGIRIPQDIAVMGTDNSFYSEISCPRLTTIQFDSTELGLRTVALMNHLITGEPISSEFAEPPHPVLIEREST